ncbi:MAG TPA: DEAD/DEAH box helicase [bacterium]|nr:DEAD/DEAH box helicase [bacterium]
MRPKSTLADLLRGLGEAPAVPFAPAAFQMAALAALARGDVLVSAPTGSGKTWIAEQEIARFLARGRGAADGAPRSAGRIWYTAPLKALSNQKFRRLEGLYGAEVIGLLTGERRVNPRAPVLVATTEILRNALYDPAGTAPPPEVIVLDEAHYLADPERGTAWEEILLLAPPETRLLLLSATIPNAHDLAGWLGEIRGHAPDVVTLDTRPVPLQFLLADGAGHLLPPDAHAVTSRGRHGRWLRTAAEALDHRHLTPAILFFPSRRECDEAARLLGSQPAPDEARRVERLRPWLAQVPQLAQHPLLPGLRRGGVAPHHAGHLTGWRMCVEDLLEAGLIRLVCATTTLAAGMDVPARTVLLSTLNRNGPAGPESLTPTEFHQMTGRAGRRGRDTLGVAVIAAETPAEADEGLALAAAAPDPVVSAFTPSDAQVLNLLMRNAMREAEALLRRSFAAYARRPRIEELRRRLAALPPDPLTDRPCGDRLATRGRFEHLLRRLRRARRKRSEPGPEVAELARAVVAMPCTGCPVVERCLATRRDLHAVERRRRRLQGEVADLDDQEVRLFQRRAGLLRDLGYLDPEWRLTAQGRVAARIRHPRMLVLAEAVRTRILPTDPAVLAAVTGALGTERVGRPPLRRGMRFGDHREVRHRGRYAPRAADLRDPDPSSGVMMQQARRAIIGLRGIVAALNQRRRAAGLPEDPVEKEFAPIGGGPPPGFQRAAVVGAWASGRPWEEIVAQHGTSEGDLQRLIWQAAEILAQLEDLPPGPLPDAAQAARQTMLRTPVL